ncbi:hypothetical protein GCM10009720_12840 [Yaniella flava]|uniref:Sce7726 family protein n=2 Tax=Yaniella flava TaxID=287930 RepID=A0ABP5FXH2_9MICC
MGAAFSELTQLGKRDDYVFRSAIVQKILLGRHSLNTSTLLNEFRIGKSRVDLAILNGKSTAYEIKSDRDSLKRINSQLDDYAKFFEEVYVVTSENRQNEVIASIPESTGLLILTSASKPALRTIRKSQNHTSQNDPEIISDSLRLSEAKELLTLLGCEIPTAPNTIVRQLLRSEFKQLGPELVNKATLEVLKKTRNTRTLSGSISSVPEFLRASVLCTQLTAPHVETYLQALARSAHTMGK